ncbi:hypothetical protein BN863_28430 [Formosa agariphila KMM 3901]|uniref:Uncharacterized protein n=1 Tax=Formosa agariphila (strain DSM 15362 / KCTC 12365 / LMG 23005 / KMM 3901 / M-2Alg 35-1) TaxID=1347342 RepID=T2KP74_FORAG|nr:hypothetical protein [Formosa agariphila]CDF80555.1 hypothetical protein BN863_28430 [Formosa agariphila KMM 3901]
MKEAVINIGKVLLGLVLIVVSLVLFIIITPLAFLWKVVSSISQEKRKVRDILSGTSLFFIQIAASYDQLGNAVFGGFFNWLFLVQKDLRYAFGDKDDTISEVLGWNAELNALNRFGVLMVKLLDYIDKNHCYNAMYSGVLRARTKVHQYENINLLQS